MKIPGLKRMPTHRPSAGQSTGVTVVSGPRSVRKLFPLSRVRTISNYWPQPRETCPHGRYGSAILFNEQMIRGSVRQVKELALTLHLFVQSLPRGHLQPPSRLFSRVYQSRFCFRPSEVLRCSMQAGTRLYETAPGWSARTK